MAMRVRGETITEMVAATRVLREKSIKIKAPVNAIDIVGTGGTGLQTLNISTASAFTVAGCGVPVAKHGNKAMSSKSGTADVQKALGINIEADFPIIEKSMSEAGVGFLFAMRHHSAMRFVGSCRIELGIRSIFNLIGPLCNPANVKYQFTGAFSKNWISPMANVLCRLGAERAWVVHGSDGMDELTTTGPSSVVEVLNGKVSAFEVTPEDALIPRASLDDLKGGSPEYNARKIEDILSGSKGPFRDIVLLNAGGALLVANRATSLKEGVEMAVDSLDTGKALRSLKEMIRITNSH